MDELAAALPLPRHWSKPELFADTVEVDGTNVRRAGLQSSNAAGFEITGSAACRGADPLPRARYELLERAATVDAEPRPTDVEHPTRRLSRSNGIALHRTWSEACAAASLELIERDQILRAWFGENALRSTPAPPQLEAFASYTWAAAIIISPEEVTVAVVLGFPRKPSLPLARGFGASPDAAAAVDKASAEAQQNLAFVWGEPLPTFAPELAPNAMFHLDHFLWPAHHAVLRRWIAGEPIGPAARLPPRPPLNIEFTDVRGADWRAPLAVARAHAQGALPLVFGVPPTAWGHLSPEQRIHPVS